MKQASVFTAIVGALALANAPAQANTATLYFDYVATNSDQGGGGYISTGTGGAYSYVATMTLTDLSDLGISGGTSADGTQTYSNGGVRLTISNDHSTDIFGSTPSSATAIGSFELNFPNTQASGNDFTSNYVNWGNNTGVFLAYNATNPNNGGVEWQEAGCTTAANSGACTTVANAGRAQWNGWGQQFNYGGNNGTNVDKNGNVVAFTQGGSSSIDLFNPASDTNISVSSLLANAVAVTGNNVSGIPNAIGWLNAIMGLPLSNDPNGRAVPASGFWGTSINGTSTANTNNRVQILATHYSLNGGAIQPVPIPAPIILLLSSLLGFVPFFRRQTGRNL